MMIIVAALVGSDAAQMYDYVQLCRQKSTSIPYPELDKCKMRDDALALSDDVAVVLPGDEIHVATPLDDAQIQESYSSVGECPSDDALALPDDVAVVLPGDEIDVATPLDDAQIQESDGSQSDGEFVGANGLAWHDYNSYGADVITIPDDADEDKLEEFASAITQGKCHSAAIVQRA
jgi:hypothetical protein